MQGGLYGNPPEGRIQRYVFGPTGATGGNDFQSWSKPPGCSMLHIYCLGSGGGGGGGRGNAAGAGNIKGGGGGGASGGLTKVLVPFALIPDCLYILVGWGGSGGAGGSSANGADGGVGRLSRVSVYPNVVAAAALLAVSGSTAPAGGTGGTAIGGSQPGGAAGTVAALANMLQATHGDPTFLAGVAGGPGSGSDASPTALTPGASGNLILPGCGGAGCETAGQNGGGFAAVADSQFIAWSGTSGNGSDGFIHAGIHYGGLGGGSSNAATGANGGGAVRVPGAGGGGGGGGVTIGGRGGDGGPGLVILTCW